MNRELRDRVVVVTGASSGIGREVARAFAREGAVVLVLARRAERLEELVREIASAGGSAYAVAVDLGDAIATKRAAERILKEHGAPAVVVNNAGAGRWLAIDETDPEEAVAMTAVPYLGAFALTATLSPAMIAASAGVIVNVTSPAAIAPFPGSAAYSVARAAMKAFDEALEADLRGTGVRPMLFMAAEVESEYFDNNPGTRERLPWISKYIGTLSPTEVARALVDGVKRGRRSVVVPLRLRMVLSMYRWFPGTVKRVVWATGWRRAERAPDTRAGEPR